MSRFDKDGVYWLYGRRHRVIRGVTTEMAQYLYSIPLYILELYEHARVE